MQIQYYQQQPQQQVIYQQQYYQPQPQVLGVVYQQQVLIPPTNIVYPTVNTCVYCGNPYQLLCRRNIGVKAFLICFLLLLVFWPLFWLPFVMDDCQDKVYYCYSCGAVIRSDSSC